MNKPPPLRKTRFSATIFSRFRFRESGFPLLFFSDFESYGFIFFRFWARGFIFFRFPGPKSCSNLNQTFSFPPLEIAFWMLKTPIFFRLRRAKFQGWGFIFFKFSRASRGVLFFSDFDFGKVISGFYFFQILELGVLFFFPILSSGFYSFQISRLEKYSSFTLNSYYHLIHTGGFLQKYSFHDLIHTTT